MAVKNHLIALCLVSFVATLIQANPEAKPEAEADADAYYGYGGYRGGYRHYGYRPYNYGGYYRHRPYYYKPHYKQSYYKKAYVSPKPIAPSPPAPAPFVKSAPEPTNYIQYEEPVAPAAPAPLPAPQPQRSAPYTASEGFLKAFNAVPAVPEDHLAYNAAPAPAPREIEDRYINEEPIVYNEPKYYDEPAPAIDVIAAAPEAPAAPVAPAVAAPAPGGLVASQYHAQDEFGNVVYGYSNPNSAKTEQRDAYGNVVGSYSYIDGTGYPKHVSYVADDFGFRITAANNLPVARHP